MTTRSKSDIYKPKLLTTILGPHGYLFELKNYRKGFHYLEWKKAMQKEIHAL